MISVIMSAYNDENSVKLAIDSILNQNYQDFEFLIMDDFSTDNTFEICKDYSKLDERIIVYRNDTNLGLTKSLNKGIKIAKGEYIARMDADDICNINRFALQINYLQKNPCMNGSKIQNQIIKKIIIFYYLKLKWQEDMVEKLEETQV